MIWWLGYACVAAGAWAYCHWYTDVTQVLLWRPLDRLLWPPPEPKALDDRRDLLVEQLDAKRERRRESRRLGRVLLVAAVLCVVWSGALHVHAQKRALLEARRDAARMQPPPWGCLTQEERDLRPWSSTFEWIYPQTVQEETCAQWMARVHASVDPDLQEVLVDTLFVAPARAVLLVARSIGTGIAAVLSGLGWIQELVMLAFVLALVWVLLWHLPSLARIDWQAVWHVMRGRTRDELQEEGVYAARYPHLIGEWETTPARGLLKEC